MRSPVILGAYVPGNTPVHRMDARVKLVLLVMATAASFASPAPLGLCVAAAGLAAALVASGTSPRAVLHGLRPAALFLALSVLGNAVVLVDQPGVSPGGLVRGVVAVTRIALVVGFALVLSSTSQQPAIADALASLMAPLGRLGVPVGSVSTATSLALRFIPLVTEEVQRIRAAQRARGARPDEGGVVRRVAAWGQVFVPLVVALFRRADELARAMTDRCYTGEQTSMSGPLGARDRAALVAGAVWVVLALLARLP